MIPKTVKKYPVEGTLSISLEDCEVINSFITLQFI